MRRRSSVKAGITIYLTLTLSVLLSFLFTALEAARINGTKALLDMVSSMSARSFKGTYYFPLFDEYGILAVDGGLGKSEMDLSKVEKELLKYLAYPFENSEGCLLNGTSPRVKVKSVKTLLTGEKAGLREQIREEALYEGAELFMEEITGNEMFDAVKVLPAVYEKQAKAMESAAVVTREILKLMTLTDGIRTTDTGLYADENGKFAAEYNFVKHLGLKDNSYMKGTYGNLGIYEMMKPFMVYGSDVIKRAEGLIDSASVAREELLRLQKKLYQEKKKAEELVKSGKPEKETADAIKALEQEIKDKTIEAEEKKEWARSAYELTDEIFQAALKKTEEAILCLAEVRIKQKAAEAVIDEYSEYIKGLDDLPGTVINSLVEDRPILLCIRNIHR